jgi:hypothetical protein
MKITYRFKVRLFIVCAALLAGLGFKTHSGAQGSLSLIDLKGGAAIEFKASSSGGVDDDLGVLRLSSGSWEARSHSLPASGRGNETSDCWLTC